MAQFLPALNNLKTTLTSAVGLFDTTVNVLTTSGWPTSGIFSIDNEIFAYTGTTATSFTGCTRGYDNTGAAAHAHLDGGNPRKVALRIIAKHITEIQETLAQLGAGILTVPLSVGVNDLDQLATQLWKSVDWFVQLVKTSPATVRDTHVTTTHDGSYTSDATDAFWSEFGGSLSAGTHDVTLAVDVNGTGASQMQRLRATAASTGWTAMVRRVALLPTT